MKTYSTEELHRFQLLEQEAHDLSIGYQHFKIIEE
jgi:hypothetical protein